MSQVTEAIVEKLRSIVGSDHVITQANALGHDSRDFYWFSPVLKPQLGDKAADVIVRPPPIWSSWQQLIGIRPCNSNRKNDLSFYAANWRHNPDKKVNCLSDE
jgi:hypothetical protein